MTDADTACSPKHGNVHQYPGCLGEPAAACRVLSVSRARLHAWHASAEARTVRTAQPVSLSHPGLCSLVRGARGLLCGRVAAPLRSGAPAELLDERRQLAPHRNGLRLPRDRARSCLRIACAAAAQCRQSARCGALHAIAAWWAKWRRERRIVDADAWLSPNQRRTAAQSTRVRSACHGLRCGGCL